MAPAEPPLAFELIEETGDWQGLEAAGMLPEIAKAVRRHVPDAAGTVALVLADDALVHDLNLRFRGVDKPTNVLSFSSGEAPAASAPLGDVVLAAETVRREARQEGKPFEHHFMHLCIHGLLHLLGYDHADDEEASEMEGLEARILGDLAVADPYAEIADASAL